MQFDPSPYQRGIFDWVDDVVENGGREAAAVNAVAGSGKTTTLVEALKRMTGKIGFFAFNVAICKELSKKVPRHVTVRTLNSLGYATLRKAYRTIKVCEPHNAKMRRIVDGIMGEELDDRTARTGAIELASIAKLTLTDPTNGEELYDLIDRYNIDTGGNDTWVVDCIPEILKECLEDSRECDFNDQLWAPIQLGIQPEKYDWIGLDECQDLSNAQRTLVLRARKGHVLACGDPRQAIYGFAAADCDSFAKVVRDTGGKQLPLSICYRCPKSHIDLAKTIVPQIEAAPNATDGVVINFSREEISRRAHDGDLILCRCTAPLVEICMDLVSMGKKATVKGRDIGKSLMSLVRRIRRHDGSINLFLSRLAEYSEREIRKLLDEKRESKVASLNDRVDTIYALAEGVQTVNDLEEKIADVFKDSVQGITLSTIHRAKGLEATNVFLFRPDLLPHPAAKRDWEQEQEQNLLYVAYTRAKSLLALVDDEGGRERERKLQEARA